MDDSDSEREASSNRKGFWISERELFYLVILIFIGEFAFMLLSVAQNQFFTFDGLFRFFVLFPIAYFAYFTRRRRRDPISPALYGK